MIHVMTNLKQFHMLAPQRLTCWSHRSRCKINVHMLFNHWTHTACEHQWVFALPGAKIELGSICDTWFAASPTSFISSLVFKEHITTWVIERWTEVHTPVQLVVVMHLKVGCQTPYNVQRRSLKEERWLETNLVYLFIWLIVRVEVPFR